MASRRSTRVSNLLASLATLNLVNRATLAANEYNNSASGALRKHKLTNLAIDASLSFQRPNGPCDVHSRLTTRVSDSRWQRARDCNHSGLQPITVKTETHSGCSLH